MLRRKLPFTHVHVHMDLFINYFTKNKKGFACSAANLDLNENRVQSEFWVP